MATWDRVAAEAAGDLAARLEARGRNVHLRDTLIAGIALARRRRGDTLPEKLRRPADRRVEPPGLRDPLIPTHELAMADAVLDGLRRARDGTLLLVGFAGALQRFELAGIRMGDLFRADRGGNGHPSKLTARALPCGQGHSGSAAGLSGRHGVLAHLGPVPSSPAAPCPSPSSGPKPRRCAGWLESIGPAHQLALKGGGSRRPRPHAGRAHGRRAARRAL